MAVFSGLQPAAVRTRLVEALLSAGGDADTIIAFGELGEAGAAVARRRPGGGRGHRVEPRANVELATSD